MLKRAKPLISLAVSVSLVALFSVPALASTGKAAYKIGVSEPLSGAASSLGVPVVKSIKLGAKEINKQGGINGHPIQLIIRDDHSKPHDAVVNFKKLIDDGVYGIIGPNQGSNTLAVGPIVKRDKVPLCAFNNTISITQRGNPYIFRCQVSDLANIKAALIFAKNNLKANRIGMMYTSDAYGTDAYHAVQKEAKKIGLKVSGAEEIQYTTSDTTPEWEKLMATKPQAVLLWGSGSAMSVALRNASQLGNKVPIIGGQGVATKGIIDSAGKAANGLYLLSLVAPKQMTSMQRELKTLLAKKNGSKAQLYTYNTIGWDAIHIYATAIKKAAGKKSNMLKAMDSIRGLKLASGTYSFSKGNHNGLNAKSLWIVQVRNGKVHGVQHGFGK